MLSDLLRSSLSADLVGLHGMLAHGYSVAIAHMVVAEIVASLRSLYVDCCASDGWERIGWKSFSDELFFLLSYTG